MRDYTILTPKFWIGQTGKSLRGQPEAQIVALYLMSSPHANMLGLYYLPLPYIAHETGLSIEGALKGLASLSEAGFALYDEVSEYVWVVEMAKYQVGEQLDQKDNRVKGIHREYESLSSNRFLRPFYERYQAAFHLKKARDLQAPLEPLRSQDHDQEQDQEQEKTLSRVELLPQPIQDAKKSRTRRTTRYEDYPGFCELFAMAVVRPSGDKGDKGKALERWREQTPNPEQDPELLERILQAYAFQKQSRQWQNEGGKFVPEIQVWIGQKRWESVEVPDSFNRRAPPLEKPRYYRDGDILPDGTTRGEF